MRSISQFLRNKHAATSIEYGLICALVVIGIIVSLNLFAGAAVGLLTNVSNEVVNAG